ncbi:nodulation protein NfeD [Moorellaceae bacterium AZ2]
MNRFVTRSFTVLLLSAVLTLTLSPPRAVGSLGRGIESPPAVYVLRVEGPIVPVVADYIQYGIQTAYEQHGACLILELSTPGGLYATTQKIVESILNSPVPVVVYVSPAGAWAGSAGTFITIAAHVAAMAPGSRIGAAHPVAIDNDSGLSETQKQKMAQDAAAWVRSIAQLRGRDPSQAELAVLESRSFSDSEAIQAKLVDLQASDRADLLAQLQGRKVSMVDGREVALNVVGLPVREIPMSSVQRLLFGISDPNIAYILMSIGTIGLLAELYNPGAVFPGVVGGISLILGLYALGSLNAQLSGLVLLLLGLGLLAAEVFVVSHGLLAAGGLVSFILGSLMLFSGGPPVFRVSLSLIALTALIMMGFVAFLLGAVVKAQRRPAVTGRESLEGTVGVALTDLKPEGILLLEGERWKAESIEPVEAGEKVKVIGVEGLKLKVKKP